MVVAVTAYGMATLEGPILAIKSVNALSHYNDEPSLTFTLAPWLE
jgi:cytochrome c oxidase cbb3-type subunit I/II